MKLMRFALSFVLAAVFLAGVPSFFPSSACGGSWPGSCRDASQPIDTDFVVYWAAGRMLVGLYG